ncbi:MAG: class I SAM-dependent methyltransferase, partial [Gemmatimonadetes bacterium]|nr:class I SAM-dependent methyltransferase [Gemmatimonadota bacterium]
MDYEAWADWYDVFYSLADPAEVDFYVDLARASGGPVLEIGVGTGRIAIPTAAAGIDVVGVDLHGPMLAKAREKLDRAGPLPGRIELLRADMRTLDLGGRCFPLVTIPARTLLLATSLADQRRTLRRAAAHLAPGRTLAFNVF